MRDIVYRYYGDRSDCNHHQGIICVATKLNTQTHILTIGASFCSPKERFDKAIAKKIAKGRMEEDRTKLAITVKPSINHIEINAIITDNLHLLTSYPLGDKWVKNAIHFSNNKHLNKV